MDCRLRLNGNEEFSIFFVGWMNYIYIYIYMFEKTHKNHIIPKTSSSSVCHPLGFEGSSDFTMKQLLPQDIARSSHGCSSTHCFFSWGTAHPHRHPHPHPHPQPQPRSFFQVTTTRLLLHPRMEIAVPAKMWCLLSWRIISWEKVDLVKMVGWQRSAIF